MTVKDSSTRSTWITRFPTVVSLAFGVTSLFFVIVWKTNDWSAGSLWIMMVMGISTAQAGLILSVSAAVAAPRGSKWRATLPGLAASVAAIAFWALSA